ncbi:MAG: DUF6261 family protein [Bacteroidales bacterium]|nr:DUF6261 family protein [Bacteroidales bacterium]
MPKFGKHKNDNFADINLNRKYMKHKKIDFHRLQNAEHFEFHADVLADIAATTAEALKSAEHCAVYAAAFSLEDGLVKQIRMDALTAEIEAADRSRDTIFRGFKSAWESAMNHFNPEVTAMARRLEPIFHTYGNVASEAHAKESADMYNMLQELGKHTFECDSLGFKGWIVELKILNGKVEELMRRRYGEQAQRPTASLREVRLEVDAAFYLLTERVEALALIEGGPVYGSFIARVNAIIDRAAGILAARRGRTATEKAKENNTADN